MHVRPPLTRTLVAGACALLACAAQAQSSPFYFRASETLTYDSNVFRVPEVLGRSRDGISSTNLTVGLDQPYGRQRWLASAGVTYNKFKNQDQLDNTGYDLLLGLDWSALSRWSGDVRLESTQQLANFENYGAQATVDIAKNLERANSLDLRAQYGGQSLWVLEGTFAHRDVNYSDALFDSREYRFDQVGLGAAYQPSDLLRLGLAARYTDGNYPHGGAAGGEDKFRRDDVDLTATWKASGLSTLDARLSATHENHDLDIRDFRGVTGSVGWNYRPTGKTTIDLRLARDTGTRGNGAPVLVDPAISTNFLTDARLSDRIYGAVRWEATGKITLRAQADYSHDRYDEQFFTTVGGGTAFIPGGGSGNTRNYLVGVAYQATRAWSLGCDAGRRSRSTPVQVNNVGYSYDATIAHCNVTLMLQ
ncbi:MAG: hypothetical protein ACM3N6_15535 [Betaproteobacteria bacterium]